MSTTLRPPEIPFVPESTEPLPSFRSTYGRLLWLSSVDHKQIGIMYILAALVFFVIAGLEALLMRVQLIKPENTFLSPQLYNQLFTMHGTTMVFLVGMPIVAGIGNYLIPLMIGARDVVFPRLNAFSFWAFLFGGLLLHFSFIAGGAPSGGWFAYPPLTGLEFSTGPGQDYYSISLFITGMGSIGAAINIIVTTITLRAPGMTLRRMPAFVWTNLAAAAIILFAIPFLNVTLVSLFFDRQLGASFYRPIAGGSSLLYQHYFWSFGHPEVYILILPFFGIVSEVLPTFSRKPLYGYAFVVGSSLAIVVLSALTWGHHMWAAGMGFWLDIFFVVATMLIAVPTGVKIFNWLATVWGGQVRYTTPMLFALAFLIEFVIGGVTGVQFAVIPFNRQITDTYYVVAHFHYVLYGGTILAFFSGLFYWFPKVTGRMYDERLGKWTFWTMIVGFNTTFFIQHVLGWQGMPRRVYTYPDLPGYAAMNFISTVGSFILAVSILLFVVTVLHGLLRGQPAGNNPWDAHTLEWATTSPPPVHNFDQVPPIRSRRPVWDLNHPEHADSLQRGH
jgi:cytochrome c oxidase subunit 1/cytochrome c oxidase subunit I+III